MNLHAAVRGAITTVNPDIVATYLRSTGNNVDAAGNQTPTYAAPVTPVGVQVQAVDDKALKHADKLSLESMYRSVYMYGNTTGIVRRDLKGGDILQFPQVPGAAVESWLVINVVETWPDWCHVLVVLQND